LVTTQAATNITTTAATLNGTVNAQGTATSSITIRYSTVKADVDVGSGTQASVSPSSLSGSTATNITANVTGLTPSTTYYFRASATNAGGTANGATLSFTTGIVVPPPLVVTLPATSIGLNSATLNGSVNPNGSNTSQITLKYSQNKSEVDAGGGTATVVNPTSASGSILTPFSSNPTNLQPNTLYHFRASATTPGGIIYGATLSFTTISKSDILVPTAFSPNGDGQNDVLIPIVVGIQKFGYFRIMNRWGQVVYETREMGKGWDGTYRGNPQPMDTYSWVVEAVDVTGKSLRKNGGTLLVR
jgi:gliding motility-associated-like protein